MDKVRCVQTEQGNAIRLDKSCFTIPPNSSIDFMLTLDSIRTETVEEYFEIMVKNSDTSLFFEVLAEI